MGISKRLISIGLLTVMALATAGLATADRQPDPTPPPCNMDTKAGYIELNPRGTISATTLITFSTPFCSNNYVLGANLVTPFDEGVELPAPTVRLYAPNVASVTIRLEQPSDFVYNAHWTAVQETQ